MQLLQHYRVLYNQRFKTLLTPSKINQNKSSHCHKSLKLQNLQKQIWYLEETVDDLEQFGRRNSLRFHNCLITDGNIRYGNIDKIVTAIRKESLNINLSEDDIIMPHIIGKPDSRAILQIICKMKN